MSRPLAWVLALAIAAVLALSLLVTSSGPGLVAPEPFAAGMTSAPARLELAGTTETLAAAAVSVRQPIEADATVVQQDPAAFLEPIEPVKSDGVIEGVVVREEDGLPIANAWLVLAYDGNAFPRGGLPPISKVEHVDVVTGPDGSFRFSALAHGMWQLTASSHDRKSVRERVHVQGWPPKIAVTLKLQLQRHVVVRVTDFQGRLATAESLGVERWLTDVLCMGVSRTCSRPGTTFENDGTVAYHARSKGGSAPKWDLEIRQGGPACVHLLRGDVVLATRELFIGETEVEMRLDAQDLARGLTTCDVQVVDEIHGHAVAGAVVRFRPKVGRPRDARSDSEGRASAGPSIPGAITLEVSAPGFASLRQVAQVPLTEPVVLRLSRGRRVEGIVLDLSGAPVGNVRVSIQTEADSRRPRLGQSPRSVPTGADGRFVFDLLSLEAYVVSAPERLASVDDNVHSIAAQVKELAKPEPTRSVDLRERDALDVVLRIHRNAF